MNELTKIECKDEMIQRQSDQEVLTSVLENKSLAKHFGNKKGEFTAPQKVGILLGVAAAQQRLSEQKEEARRREISLLAKFFAIYQVRLFQTAEGSRNCNKRGGGLGSVITWGNLFAGAAVILVAVAFYQTKLTSSYKDKSEFYQEQTAQLENDYKAKAEENRTLVSELAREKARADFNEEAMKKATGSNADLQKSLTDQIKVLAALQAKIAGDSAGKRSEATYQNLYNTSKKELQRLEKELEAVQSEMKKLKQQKSQLVLAE